MKGIPFTQLLQVVRPEYAFLRIKPNNAVRNQGTHRIARAIAALYKGALANIKAEEQRVIKALGREFVVGTRYSWTLPAKVSYYIYMEQRKVEFFFIVPRTHLSYLREKMSDVWGQVTIEEVPELPVFGADATRYELVYEKEDALSLAVDRRSNDLLNSNLNAVELLEEGDRLGVFYNFLPGSQISWRHLYRATIDKVNRRMPVERNKMGTAYAFKYLLAAGNVIFKEIGEALGSGRKTFGASGGGDYMDALLDRLNGARRVSESTAKKATATVLDTQIVVMAESTDGMRQRNAARSLAQSFDTVSEDNRLTTRPFRRVLDMTARDIRAGRNKIGDEEAQSFIALAGRDVLERYNFIERVETQETEVPDDLKQGVMCIGTNTYRGHEQQAFLSTDREYQNLTTVLIGPTRAGKSTLIGNLSRDAIAAGECVIIFDFVGQCELSREVAAAIPPDKTLVIDCADPRRLQGIGYNEVGKSADPFEAYDGAKKQTTQLLTLVNSINAEETKLSAKMQRYLVSAALVAFISGGSVRDVFDCLQDHETRERLIKAVPAAQRDNLRKYIRSLGELDDRDKGGAVVGTKETYVVGIIDRLNQLEQNAYMERMLDKGTAGNVDLVAEMQRNQLICIRMPSDMFGTDSERDVYTTYWSTKIWLALQMRSKRLGGDRSKMVKVNLIVDELYQVLHTEQFMRSKLSQYAKFGLKPIISAHYLNQIKHIREELRSANASYMLISGCDKQNHAELRSELLPYQEEDLLKLPRFHSLNLIKNQDGYARFITRLPRPVSPSR
ncbi:hypothetical protein [Paenibacillus sp. RUD330]|uniref:hypothetical protein n=1 Tax=Paenibacillus sp. RUD330 TaxID=2023772 RepID=UPI000B9276B0|nr:hypothetical protein [Paenibacillus sp. RUD330]ASS66531.1 hypothetical protein CIC07_10460 [Paenibacillus sp. RUD330]